MLPICLNVHVRAFPFAAIVGAFIAVRHRQSGLKEVTDGRAERVFLIESVSLNVMCGNFPLGVIVRGNYSGAVTLAAASPAHFTHSQPRPLSSSPEILLSLQCVRLETVNEVCPAVLLTGSTRSPDWCLGSKACSHMSAVQLTHPPFCNSSIWQDPPRLFPLPPLDCTPFCLSLWARRLYCCLYAPATHHPTVHSSADDNRQMAGWYA